MTCATIASEVTTYGGIEIYILLLLLVVVVVVVVVVVHRGLADQHSCVTAGATSTLPTGRARDGGRGYSPLPAVTRSSSNASFERRFIAAHGLVVSGKFDVFVRTVRGARIPNISARCQSTVPSAKNFSLQHK